MEAFRADITTTLVWMVFRFFKHHPTMFQENLSGLYCFEWCSDFLTPSCYVLGKIFWISFQLLEKNKALKNVPWLLLVSKVTLLYLCCCYQNEMIVVNLLFWRVATLNEVQLISCLQISCTSSPLFR